MTPFNPLVEHVAVLRRRPGTQQPFHAEVPLEDLVVTSARVPIDAPVVVELTLESINEGVVAAGTVSFTWEGGCRRCLKPVRGHETLAVREIFETHPTEGATYPLGPDSIDLEPVVREAVLVSLPLAPLCAEDCAGPAPEQFPTAVEGEGPTVEEPGGKDPRWGALDGLRFDQ